MITNIVVPTDGSDHAKKACDLAGDLAAKYGAAVTILHVMMSDASLDQLQLLATEHGADEALMKQIEELVQLPMESFSYGSDAVPMSVPVPPGGSDCYRRTRNRRSAQGNVRKGGREYLRSDGRRPCRWRDHRRRRTHRRRHDHHGQPRTRQSERYAGRKRIPQGEQPVAGNLRDGQIAFATPAFRCLRKHLPPGLRPCEQGIF
jgi:hypothetical protein